MTIKEMLRQCSDEDLNAEVERRKQIRKQEHEKKIRNRISCANCIYRKLGYASKGSWYHSFICTRRPKAGMFNTSCGEPKQVYFACSMKYTNNCELFIRKS